MAQIMHHAGESSVYEVEGTRVDVSIVPSVTAYMEFFTSSNGEAWTVLIPGRVYSEPIEKTFDGPSLGKFVKCQVYGGVGQVSLSASGRTIPPLVVDSAPTIAASDLWAGNTLTMTPATFSGGTTPYTITNRWQMNQGDSWKKVGDGTTYTIPDGDQFYGAQLRAQSTCTDSSSLWDVPDNTIKSNSAAVTIIEEPVPPISVTRQTEVTGTVKVGKTLTAVAPQWTGGGDESSVTSYQWLNQNDGLLETGTAYIIDVSQVGNRIRCVATISSPTENVTSESTPSGSVPPLTQIGPITVSINDIDYDYNTTPPLTVLMNDPVRVAVTNTGDAENITYEWQCRQSGAQFTITNVEADGSVVDITVEEARVLTFSCGIRDVDAEDSPKSIEIQLYAVDALKEAVSIGPVTVTIEGNTYSSQLSYPTNTVIELVASHAGSAYDDACHYKWRVMSGGGAMLGSNTASKLTFNVGNFPATNNVYVDVTCGAADDSPQTFGPIYIQAG